MKYLKTYEAQHVNTIAKRFKSEYDKINTKLVEIEEYVKDILIPLTDDGYDVKTNVCDNITDNHISLSISSRNHFELGDIKDVLLHLNSYLKSKGIDSPILLYLNSKAFSWLQYNLGYRTIKNYENGEEYKSYQFFVRLYPKKVKELRVKIDAIRNSN
jgi:hypothetical protein